MLFRLSYEADRQGRFELPISSLRGWCSRQLTSGAPSAPRIGRVDTLRPAPCKEDGLTHLAVACTTVVPLNYWRDTPGRTRTCDLSRVGGAFCR